MQDPEDIELRERIAVQVASVGWDTELAEKMYRWIKNGKLKVATNKQIAAKPFVAATNGGAAKGKRAYTKKSTKYWAKKKK